VRLGLRLFFGVFLIIGLAAFFVMRVFVAEVKPGVRQAMEATLVDTAHVLAALASDDLANGTIADGAFARAVAQARHTPPEATISALRKRQFDYRIYVTDARGIVRYDSSGEASGQDYSRWNDVYRTLRGQYGARSSASSQQDRADTVMYVAATVLQHAPQGDRIIGVLTVAKANRTMAPVIRASQMEILRKGGLLLALSALIGLATTAWLAAGIARLTRYARAVAAGKDVPPPPPRNDEIGTLGQALETMRRKLEGKDYVERYVQALTHEMKSPLAAIRGAAELLQEPLPEAERQRFAGNVVEQGARLTTMIDKLLALAAVEQRGWLQQRERVAVGAWLDDVARDLQPVLAAQDVALEVVASAPGLMVEGDGFLLRQALRNLVDNAIAFSPPGAPVMLTARRDGDEVQVDVADRGAGIPEYARENVFERFYSLPRADGHRSSGLGLPFVREVARLHGGAIALQPREGGGSLAVLRLPAA
jgi:two-component system sensor histidine kinase CreC